MGDLKTPFTQPGMPLSTDLGGALATSRGTDPNINTGGSSGLTGSPWASPFVPTPGGEETGNSVSGLPMAPNRYQPSDQPPGPPDLTQRSPGTIDQQ